MTGIISYIRRITTTLTLALAVVACGDTESFSVEGHIEDNATINIRYIYYANGVLNRGITASREGKFEFKGVSQTPTIVTITDNDYRPLGWLFLANGNRVECSITRGNPFAMKVNGNEVSERWAHFLNENADKLKSGDSNILIEKYVADKSDDIVSTLLMLTMYDSSYDAFRADSIMSSINQEARPATLVDGYNALLQRLVTQTVTEPIEQIPYFNRYDSLVCFKPQNYGSQTLIVMSDEYSGRSDSIIPALHRLHKLNKTDINIIDLSMDRDTVRWHRSTLNDSAKWTQGWVAGSLASPGFDRLGIPSLPYFIIVDSTGTQTMRTAAISTAEAHFAKFKP